MEKRDNVWRIIAFIMCIFLIIITILYIRKPDSKTTEKANEKNALSSWTDDAAAKNELMAFMNTITDEKSPDFIPVERRIAVFDLDGTLFSETNPIYFDHSLLLHRIFEDPDYMDKASDFELDVAAKILQWVQDGEYPKNMDVEHGQSIASSFSGMTIDEFEDYVEEYGNEPAPGYDGMTRAQSLYKPMLEIIDYLYANDFTCYVVSGTDRLIVRGGLRNTLPIPMNNIIGSDEALIATGQGEEDGLSYQFASDDKVLLKGQFNVKNLKMNKVTAISREIGLQPVLSFGNSSGDYSMARYVANNNPYKSLAFMLCCDDTEREYGNPEKAEKMRTACEEEGWIAISMKNDWKTIYGEGVTKNPDAGLDIYNKEFEEIKDRLKDLEPAA